MYFNVTIERLTLTLHVDISQFMLSHSCWWRGPEMPCLGYARKSVYLSFLYCLPSFLQLWYRISLSRISVKGKSW